MAVRGLGTGCLLLRTGVCPKADGPSSPHASWDAVTSEVYGIDRNRCTDSIGMGVRKPPESAARAAGRQERDV